PISTRFPYTTLFRSLGDDEPADRTQPGDVEGVAEPVRQRRPDPGVGQEARRQALRPDPATARHCRSDVSRDRTAKPGIREFATQDRKSTRLNSSHVK